MLATAQRQSAWLQATCSGLALGWVLWGSSQVGPAAGPAGSLSAQLQAGCRAQPPSPDWAGCSSVVLHCPIWDCLPVSQTSCRVHASTAQQQELLQCQSLVSQIPVFGHPNCPYVQQCWRLPDRTALTPRMQAQLGPLPPLSPKQCTEPACSSNQSFRSPLQVAAEDFLQVHNSVLHS